MKKKLFILCLFILLFISGCYDYKEVSDLAFITAIGIDYEDDKYKLTIEVLKSESEEKGKGSTPKAYNESAKGKTIAEVFDQISLKLSSYPYYYHLKAVVISEDVAKKKMQDIIDYTTRAPEIRNQYYLVVAKDVKASDLIKATNENEPIAGENIMNMIKNSYKTYSPLYNKLFEDNLKTFLGFGIDTIANSFTIKDKNIVPAGIALFKDYKFIENLSVEESSLLNGLMASDANYLLTKKEDGQEFIVDVYSSKPKISFKNNKIKIEIELMSEIRLNTKDINLRKQDVYNKLNDEFAKIAQKKYEKLLHKLQNLKVDPLGISQKYYQKTKNKDNNYFWDHELDIKASMKINKNGLIYEVEDE